MEDTNDEQLTADKAEAKAIEKACDDFLADPRTIRYRETDENRDLLLGFLEDHGLAITHRNLLFAYDSLQDTLELIPFQQPIPAPEPTPSPVVPAAVPVAPSPPSKRQFLAFRNGQPITEDARRL